MAFLSTLSLRRATRGSVARGVMAIFFYPRSPCGERLRKRWYAGPGFNFLSTLSLRRATRRQYLRAGREVDFSIHALLAESDCRSWAHWAGLGIFYPRSPCGERPEKYGGVSNAEIFLSTLSLRRATVKWQQGEVSYGFSIHALLAESDPSVMQEIAQQRFSIHALLAESDVKGICFNAEIPDFLSTLSLRRATHYLLQAA